MDAAPSLPVEQLVHLLIRHRKHLIVRRDRVGVEVARQTVVMLGEAGPGVEVPLGRQHGLAQVHDAIATNILKVGGDVDPLKTEGQVELSRNLQIATAAIDSTGMCLFIAFAIMDQPETFQALLDMLGSFHGINMTGDDVVALGQKVLKAERDFNARAGFTKQHDRLPRFFYTEPIAPHNLTFMMKDEELDEVFNFG